MSIHPEYLRGMRSAVSIVGDFIAQEKYLDPASLPDLKMIRDGLSAGLAIAELEMGQ